MSATTATRTIHPRAVISVESTVGTPSGGRLLQVAHRGSAGATERAPQPRGRDRRRFGRSLAAVHQTSTE